MRDLLADLLARLQATNRQQRLYLLLGVVVFVFVARFGVSWFLEYRESVKSEMRLTAQRLAGARRLLERAPETERQLERLRERYRATVAGLVPGDSPTLAAAELQERVSDLAAEKKVQIQTMQVLKDEPLGPFRQVSLRVTASGDLRNVADMLSALEYGDLRVSIPFIELSRRGAAIRRSTPVQVSRLVSATLQIAGVVRASAEGEGVTEVSAGEGDAAKPDGGGPEASPESTAPPSGAAAPPPLPEIETPREPIPEDPLGTAAQVTQP